MIFVWHHAHLRASVQALSPGLPERRAGEVAKGAQVLIHESISRLALLGRKLAARDDRPYGIAVVAGLLQLPVDLTAIGRNLFLLLVAVFDPIDVRVKFIAAYGIDPQRYIVAVAVFRLILAS
jgi:hypothetical protein